MTRVSGSESVSFFTPCVTASRFGRTGTTSDSAAAAPVMVRVAAKGTIASCYQLPVSVDSVIGGDCARNRCLGPKP